MKRKNKAISIKLLSVVGFIISVVIIAHRTPKQQTEPKQEQVENEYIYEGYEPTYYKHSNGSTSTVRINPFAGVGIEINKSEYERINDMK